MSEYSKWPACVAFLWSSFRNPRKSFLLLSVKQVTKTCSHSEGRGWEVDGDTPLLIFVPSTWYDCYFCYVHKSSSFTGNCYFWTPVSSGHCPFHYDIDILPVILHFNKFWWPRFLNVWGRECSNSIPGYSNLYSLYFSNAAVAQCIDFFFFFKKLCFRFLFLALLFHGSLNLEG